ncbi:hypothetical protein PISL3812_06712 [Talaromyces islandicus]|uniref:NAD(P)-binding protein n=1 Tax=Talaromyces islandicus TaxID=28573 RepID=A0A0U1M260_TALIS|nr:hypothetical protein PISL3812_06712 [Talaromyces islandicus]
MYLCNDKQDVFSVALNFTGESHDDTYPAISSNNGSHIGRAVFISGASKGIGRATAISYARAGASHITIAARSSLDEVEKSMLAVATQPLTILKLSLDVTNTNAVKEAAQRAIHPGGVRTDLALGMPESLHGSLKDTPELAADTFAWLTQKGRPWLGGRYVSANWDMAELESKEKEIVEGDKLKMRLVV